MNWILVGIDVGDVVVLAAYFFLRDKVNLMVKQWNYVVNQSDYTLQTLLNVTGYLSLAKTVNVAQFFLPLDVKDDIDRLNIDLNNAANTPSLKQRENSRKIRTVFDTVRSPMIVVAIVMLLVSLLGLYDIDRLNIDLNNAANTPSLKQREKSRKIQTVFDTVRSPMIVVAIVMLLVSLLGIYRRAIPDYMTWRHSQSCVLDDFPIDGFDQVDVLRLCSRCAKLHNISEVVLVRSGLIMSVYDFMTIPYWESVEGASLPRPTLEEIVVSQHDRKVIKKFKATAKRKASTQSQEPSRTTKKKKLKRKISEACSSAPAQEHGGNAKNVDDASEDSDRFDSSFVDYLKQSLDNAKENDSSGPLSTASV
ncbi:ion transport domain-containing protein [Tanacetum coccineum]|uniref:Ion transport domain-containing protein n=1 Tax=Tanacetum coccineum TaxID=301880 RepID=A0ABQ4XB48_9ASTR